MEATAAAPGFLVDVIFDGNLRCNRAVFQVDGVVSISLLGALFRFQLLVLGGVVAEFSPSRF